MQCPVFNNSSDHCEGISTWIASICEVQDPLFAQGCKLSNRARCVIAVGRETSAYVISNPLDLLVHGGSVGLCQEHHVQWVGLSSFSPRHVCCNTFPIVFQGAQAVESLVGQHQFVCVSVVGLASPPCITRRQGPKLLLTCWVGNEKTHFYGCIPVSLFLFLCNNRIYPVWCVFSV